MLRIKLRSKPKKSLATKAQRLRGQAFWLIIVGAIGFLACSLGIFQYWMSGAVSIRLGHQPVSGSDAVELLIFIGSISALFFTFGIILRFRVRSLSSGF